jgi:hypothetical protein
MSKNFKTIILILFIVQFFPSILIGQETSTQSDKELLKESQNPIANLISFPIQSDTFFGIGPFDRTQQVFQLQPVLPFKLKNINVITRTIIPLIIQPDYKPVKPRISNIASSALTNLIGTQGIGDLYRIYTISQRDGFEFNLASLPDDYNYETKAQFDPVEMNMLYEMGYEAAKNGYPWEKYPPFYSD